MFFDNDTGSASSDTYLYDPEIMTARYQLYDANGIEVPNCKGILDLNPDQLSFGKEIDLAPLDLSAGEYSLKISIKGAGLERDVTAALRLENAAPACQNTAVNLHTDDYTNEASFGTQSATVSLDKLVSDSDQDPVFFSLKDDSAADLVDAVIDGNTLSISTKPMDGAENVFQKFGNKTITVLADDHDGGITELAVDVSVASGFAQIKDIVFPVTSFIPEKGVEAPFICKPELNGAPADAALLQGITGKITIYDQNNNNNPVAEFDQQLFVRNQNTFEIKIQVPESDIDWIAKCSFFYHDYEIGSFECPISTQNKAPVIASPLPRLPSELWFKNIPSFLAFIQAPSSQEERSVDLNTLFKDPDSVTQPEYSVSFSDPLLDYTLSKDGILELLPLSAGKTDVTVTAKDGAGASASYTFSVKLTDLHMYLLILLLLCLTAIIILILIIKLIIWLLKPKFSPKGTMTVKTRQNLFGSPYRFTGIRHPKKPLRLSTIVLPNFCQEVGISHSELQNVFVVPASSDGKIKIVLKKSLNTVEITSAGSKLTVKKSLTMNNGKVMDIVKKGTPGDVIHVSYELGNKNAISSMGIGGMNQSGFSNQNSPFSSSSFSNNNHQGNSGSSPFR